MTQSIEHCTKILGPLRQDVFACLTCNPPPAKPSDPWTPAGVCYACSVSCHGEHTLVEIFQKRNFTCDCGTTRLPSSSPCSLRTNDETNTRGGVHSEEPDANNKYNHNFRNRFCACECDYDPFQQKGTMFQCLGLGTSETGGCGEDWYHPSCLLGLGPDWSDGVEGNKTTKSTKIADDSALPTISEGNEAQEESRPDQNEQAIVDEDDEDDDPPMPPGFPDEDAFSGFLCYKCVDANPWIKPYAGASGFIPVAFSEKGEDQLAVADKTVSTKLEAEDDAEEKGEFVSPATEETVSKKRKAEDDAEEQVETKRARSELASPVEPADASTAPPPKVETATTPTGCKLPNLPPAPSGRFSIFFNEDFRDTFCRCSACFPELNRHPQLLEEEEVYEPPLSNDGGSEHGGGSTRGSGSILELGESALRNVDRVRAIEGVMAYNHLKDKLKPFFQQFAESGEAIGAEDIKAYFAKLRGDEEGIKEAGAAAAGSKDEEDGGPRREQSGY